MIHSIRVVRVRRERIHHFATSFVFQTKTNPHPVALAEIEMFLVHVDVYLCRPTGQQTPGSRAAVVAHSSFRVEYADERVGSYIKEPGGHLSM